MPAHYAAVTHAGSILPPALARGVTPGSYPGLGAHICPSHPSSLDTDSSQAAGDGQAQQLLSLHDQGTGQLRAVAILGKLAGGP